ncbi:MAG TPA: hypothetical protein VMO26_07095 [Vicinamibacterales bacterium]|nr:hypothetical protein [Vicinamibacterales bacterium]
MWVDESAFERAAVEARTIQDETGFPPALDDPRLNVREILFWFPFEGDGPIDGLLRMHQPEDYATRVVVAATLHSLIGDNPSGDGYDSLASALQRLVASVAVKDLADPALLRWELHLAATANSLERALEVWHRFEEVEPTPEIRALVANTLFLLVHPSRPALDFFTPSAFDPLIHSPHWEWQRVSDLFTYILATTVEKRGNLGWSPRRFHRRRSMRSSISSCCSSESRMPPSH